MSATSGAIGAFILGVVNEEFLIGEADDVLIVTQPGATTPLTGNVPEYLQNDIQKVRGVIAISPETLCFSVAQDLNEKSILVRGITINFAQLTNITVLSGSWFDPTFGPAEKTDANGAMVGYLLAEGLGISLGDKLQLVSTLTDMILEIVITGIVNTNSPSDEEVLIPLSLGKLITNKESSLVSYFRVLIDKKIITKERLSELINQEFTVPILLRSNNPEQSNNQEEIPVVVYTPLGTHVETQKIRVENPTEFKLQFGTYEFLATPPESQNSRVLTVFVNQSFEDPFEIIVGEAHYDLELNITYNNKPVENALVSIHELFGTDYEYYSQSNDEGILYVSNLPENFYSVTVHYKGYDWYKMIKVTNSSQVDLIFESSLSLIIKNISSGQEVHGGIVRILNHTSSVEINSINDYHSGDTIYLDPGQYKVEFHLDGVTRNFSTIINGSLHKTMYVGTDSLKVWVRGENQQGLSLANVTVTGVNGFITQDNTSSDGFSEFLLDVGLKYDVTATSPINPTKNQTWEIIFENSMTFVMDFLDVYTLNVLVINGTQEDGPDNILADCNVKLFKDNNSIDEKTSNSSGLVTFDLTNPGIYQISAEKDGFSFYKSIDILSSNNTCLVRLGHVNLLVSTTTISAYPVSDVEVLAIDKIGFTYSGYTNTSGFLELIFPVGSYTIQINFDGRDYSQEQISFSESKRETYEEIIELSGDLTISLTNQFAQAINKGYIIITDEYYSLEYRGFTDNEGKVTLYGVPWGNWSVQIAYIDEVFPRRLIEVSKKEDSFFFQVESSNPIFIIDQYDWQKSKTFSVVLSAEFVSGFLQTTLAIILTTFTSLVLIISVLSLLSIASVISHPIVSNGKTIRTFRQLGASRNQINLGVLIHLSLLGILSSAIGALFGMWIMTLIPDLKNLNIGGMIIQPKMDIWILLIIVISNTGVIIAKAAQKLNQLIIVR